MTGINLTLLIGPTIAKPAPRLLTEALQSVEVTHQDDGRSGFQLVFQIGRSGSKDLQDDKLINSSLLKTFNRVTLIITIRATAKVLIDGLITHQQFSPSLEPGRSTLTITGEDVSVAMDQEERSVQHTAQDEATIAQMLIARYAQYRLIPDVKKPPVVDRPTKNQRIPVQQDTDLQYLKLLAKRFAYVFYVKPGPGVGQNTAYWGPPIRSRISSQPPITVDMGSFTNVTSINFQNDAQSGTKVAGRVQDRQSNQVQSVRSNTSQRDDRTPLAKQSVLQAQAQKKIRRIQQYRETGRTAAQALGRAEAMIDESVEGAVTVSGELDTARYGAILELRGVVGLRGVGYTYDGLYYVKSVTHQIRKGEYKQSFTIVREGLGTTVRTLGR